VLLLQELLPAIREMSGDLFAFQPHSAPAHRARETLQLLQRDTPEFFAPNLLPPNSPDPNPVDYKFWSKRTNISWLINARQPAQDVGRLQRRVQTVVLTTLCLVFCRRLRPWQLDGRPHTCRHWTPSSWLVSYCVLYFVALVDEWKTRDDYLFGVRSFAAHKLLVHCECKIVTKRCWCYSLFDVCRLSNVYF